VKRRTSPGGTESAGRVADVLLEFVHADGGPLRVSVIARRLNIGKAVVHRILQSLESRGLVSINEDRTYRLGLTAAALGARAAHQFDLRAVAHPALQHLAEATGETAALAVLVGSFWIFLDRVVGAGEIHVNIELGRPSPLQEGAPGLAILAFAPDDLRAWLMNGFRDGPAPGADARSSASLEAVVERGIAMTIDDRPGGAGIVAAPVFGPDGVTGALVACCPAERFTLSASPADDLAHHVRSAAAALSAHLGGHTPSSGSPLPQR